MFDRIGAIMKKTSSLWGNPPKRYYKFLKLIEGQFNTKPLRIAILGCSDGKFVVPAARRGHCVFAIDVDGIALFGGEKIGPSGKVHMPGLIDRLRIEGLQDLVQVVNGDFVEHIPDVQYHGVFTSGAVQYSRNLKHAMSKIVSSIQAYVMPSGYIYIDYMLPMEERYKDRDNYPGRERWQQFFSTSEWRILYNRVLPPVPEKAHVDLPVDHIHHWGHLLAQKK